MEKHYLKLLMAIVILLFATNEGFSQENQAPTTPKFKKHEFNVSVGIFNTVETFPPLDYFTWIPLFSYRNQTDRFYKIGSFNAEYTRNISKVYSLGFSLSYTFSRNTETEILSDGIYPHDPIYYNIDSHIISFFVNNRFNYIKNKNYNLYSTIGVGVTLGLRAYNQFYTPKNVYYPDFHFCLIGISFTNKIPLLLELGLGPQGIFKFGYKF